MSEISYTVVDLSFNHSVRKIELSIFNNLVDNCIFSFNLSFVFSSLFKLFTNVCSEFVHCIKFTYFTCEIVIKFRKLTFLDFLNLYFKYCVLTCKVFCMIFFRESNLNVNISVSFIAEYSFRPVPHTPISRYIGISATS